MEKKDFKPGQTVYLLPVRFLGFKFDVIERKILESTVISVGRKYITVKLPWKVQVKFDMTEDFREATNYTATYKLFLSKEDIKNDCQRRGMEERIKTAFHFPNHLTRKMSFDDLQTVFNIVKKYSKF